MLSLRLVVELRNRLRVEGMMVAIIEQSGIATRVIEKRDIDEARTFVVGDEMAVEAPNADETPVSFETGRTLSLGKFNFARFELRVGCVVKRVHEAAGFVFCKTVAKELTAREEDSVRKKGRKPLALPDVPEGVVSVEMALTYGQTISLGNYESGKVSISLAAVRQPGEAIEVMAARLQGRCGEELAVEAEAVRSPRSMGL